MVSLNEQVQYPQPHRFPEIPPRDMAAPIIRVYQLPCPAIQFLAAITEASDGIALVRTLDETRGIVECWIMPAFTEDFESILNAVRAQWPVQSLGETFE